MNTTILMIDNDAALLRLTELNLTKAGYRFVSARHGISGLQAVYPPAARLSLNGRRAGRFISVVSSGSLA